MPTYPLLPTVIRGLPLVYIVMLPALLVDTTADPLEIMLPLPPLRATTVDTDGATLMRVVLMAVAERVPVAVV